ncbi:MAG: phosphate regulon transcriptional regulator PhoB [Moraxella sp.]|nr:phosphate regulon transcriptional regulator PhoB [Moraxella sp.]
MASVLVVEDELAIQRLVEFCLQQAGFVVQTAQNAEVAKAMIDDKLPDVVVLDWMLPAMSGIEFLQRLRCDKRTKELPIILLTARGDETDKELGLNLGADDYIVKPFSNKEFVARIKALLRRVAPQKQSDTVHFGQLTLCPNRRTVKVGEMVLSFGLSEFRLLHFFMTHPNRIYSRRQLLDLVWGDHVFIEERTVDVQVGRLRRELQKFALHGYIQTVRGVGYCFGG